jgi:hypothetical protein
MLSTAVKEAVLRRHLFALALFVFASAALNAQTTASLTGYVLDGNGRGIAGVEVTASSSAMQGTRTATTGENGAYRFEALPPGDYEIVAHKNDFHQTRRRVTARLGLVTAADFKLYPLLVQSLDVVETALPVMSSPEIAVNLPLDEIEKLPIQRNQLATAQLAVGVVGNIFANGSLQISGGPGYDNLVLVNGVVVTENVRSQMRPMYVEEAIQETTILTGAISAEYGRFTGGVVNTITRSGGNALSASLRDSLTNPAWSAQTPAGEERPDTLSHVWEGTLGGPFLRDRLWFFTAGRWAKNDTARLTLAVPAFAGGQSPTAASPQLSYLESNDQKRYEVKLTAQPHARHNVTATYFGVDTKQENARFNANIYDFNSLTERNDPESLISARWDGVVATNVLAEGQYSRRRYELNSGARTTDPIDGTLLLDRANSNARFFSPTLCAVCGSERRDNDDVLLKASWFHDSVRFGTHNVITGLDRFEEQRYANNRQSGSDFSIFVTRAQYRDGVIYPVVTPTTAAGGGTFIRWTPVLDGARPDHLRTDSLFVNDQWNLGARWTFQLGARWDRNQAEDANGTVSSDDSRLSPRLAAIFDPRGDGWMRVSASFAEYSSRIAEGIAASNQSAGNAASIDFAYRGPNLNANALTLTPADVIRLVFEQFARQGGTANVAADNLRTGGTRLVPGYATYFDGSLRSPVVRELTTGFAMRLGTRAFAKVDLIRRDWRDLYAASITPSTRRVTTPFGIPVDLALYRNSENLERTYRGAQFQFRWTTNALESGVHYTWSKLRGNDDGESGQFGAIPNNDPALFYPEYTGYDRFAPTGYLQGDQRHRLRAWASYALPVPASVGRFNVSLLQTFDSGLPYSLSAPISLSRYTNAPANPGYNSIPNGLYYISNRGELRADDITATNLALRYARNVIGNVEVFAHAELLNAFNEDGIADPLRVNTTVSTAANSATLQPFNPFTDTPILGTHYQPSATFGQPLNDLAYQTPRTVRVAVGVRF